VTARVAVVSWAGTREFTRFWDLGWFVNEHRLERGRGTWVRHGRAMTPGRSFLSI
jgi:hypothetical protein